MLRSFVAALLAPLCLVLALSPAHAQDAGLAHPDYKALHEAGTKVQVDVNAAVDAFQAKQEKPSTALLTAYEALLKRGQATADAIGRTDQPLVGRIQRGFVTQGGEGLAELREGLAANDAEKVKRGLNRMSNAWSIALAARKPK